MENRKLQKSYLTVNLGTYLLSISSNEYLYCLRLVSFYIMLVLIF